MLDPSRFDVEEIATALADQTDYEHRWLIDSRTGELACGTSDGENPVEIDELDLIAIDPLPSYVWFQDMADFADGIATKQPADAWHSHCAGPERSDDSRTRSNEHHPDLIPAWHALRDARAQRRAVAWLLDQGLINAEAAQQFARDHPDPALP